ncbi:MAG: DUF3237 domain-containing protein [Phenylobacterium sp.]|uniref:DUF3237 family protein n=1 Tax=Phenylobacterium sp. TaxID=1871053 RepID=UPI002600DE8C|nr:DUF3237 family protein [Phenylobacterium sp.]MBA4013699.1 DUF3237 domain-containing protein [Phenylobacterium sp.]
MTPELSPLMTLEVLVGSPVSVDAAPHGRRFIPIIGGIITGGLDGVVLPGGGDWQTLWPDGRMDIAAHYVLDIAGQGTVEVRSEGLRHGPPEVLAALARGEAVDPTSYYFRTAVRLRTAAPGLERLNRLLALAVGERAADRVRLRVYEIG